MDFQELAERTRLPIRRLRHCLDEGLVPDVKVTASEHEVGRRRKFHDDVGFAICCAAQLLASGVDRSTIRTFLSGLAEVRFPADEKLVISALFEHHAGGTAELGDGVNMRLRLTDLPMDDYDTGWVHPGNPADLAADYSPTTIIALDIGRIAAQVFLWPERRKKAGPQKSSFFF